jgi:hypothetical protein
MSTKTDYFCMRRMKNVGDNVPPEVPTNVNGDNQGLHAPHAELL